MSLCLDVGVGVRLGWWYVDVILRRSDIVDGTEASSIDQAGLSPTTFTSILNVLIKHSDASTECACGSIGLADNVYTHNQTYHQVCPAPHHGPD